MSEAGDERSLGSILRRDGDLAGLSDYIAFWKCRREKFIARVHQLLTTAPTREEFEVQLEMHIRLVRHYHQVKEAHEELVRLRRVRGIPENMQ